MKLEYEISDLLEMYGYSASEFSKMTGIKYNRMLNIKNHECEPSEAEIEAINNWLDNRGKNVISVTFEPRETKIYSFEKRGVTDYEKYKREKNREQRRIDRENFQRECAESIRKWWF